MNNKKRPAGQGEEMGNFLKKIKVAWFLRKESQEVRDGLVAFSELKENLLKISGETDQLVKLVKFFDEISKWHDKIPEVSLLEKKVKILNYGQYDQTVAGIEVLKKHFVNAGRCDEGWNRTKKGEKVTDENVFLGNISGLFTRKVSFWCDQKNDQEGGGVEAHKIVSRQAKDFMDSHISPICEIIEKILKEVKEASKK